MINACIFGLGGTIVDKYALTSYLSLKKVFNNIDIHVDNNLILKNIGIYKNDHIFNIIINQNTTQKWLEKYNEYPDEYDIHNLYKSYNNIHYHYCKNLVTILPETEECIKYLKKNNILIGCTTNYNNISMNIIRNKLNYHNIFLDNYISVDSLNKPKPNPHMIYKTMENFNINNPKNIIKVANSITGIKEGINANCWTVGVARWSMNMGIYTIDETYSIDFNELNDKTNNCKNILKDAGADFVIDTLDELPSIIEKINYL